MARALASQRAHDNTLAANLRCTGSTLLAAHRELPADIIARGGAPVGFLTALYLADNHVYVDSGVVPALHKALHDVIISQRGTLVLEGLSEVRLRLGDVVAQAPNADYLKAIGILVPKLHAARGVNVELEPGETWTTYVYTVIRQ